MKPLSKSGLGREPLSGKFPDRLHQLRRMANMSQSDVARAVWGETTDSRGYTVARNRDRVSAYEGGRAFPEQDNLEKLAALFDIEIGELAPEAITGIGAARGKPAINLTVVDAARGLAHLTVDVVVPFATAAKVAEVLSEGGAQTADA